jgi:integrase
MAAARDRIELDPRPVHRIQDRERAVIMLLAHLGLRAGEVIRLKLEDIDWFEGGLIVRAGKIIGGKACLYRRKLETPWFRTCVTHAPQL